MSTNYYAKIHLGKTSGQGTGKPLLWIMAAGSHLLAQLKDDTEVENEYGDHITLGELRALWESMDFDYNSVGTRFS